MAESLWPELVADVRGTRVSIADGVVEPLEPWGELPADVLYVVGLADGAFPRLAGQSPVLYVGQGRPDRIGHLEEGTHSARYALAHAVAALPPTPSFEVRILDGHGFSGLLETAALTELVALHGEMPPANRRWESWLCYRVIEALARCAHAERWLPKAHDEPTEPARGCWVHRYHAQDVELGWEYSIGYLFPPDWAAADPLASGLVLVAPGPDANGALRRLLEGPGRRWRAYAEENWNEARLVKHVPMLGFAGDAADARGLLPILIRVLRARERDEDVDGAEWILRVLAEVGAAVPASVSADG